MSFPLPTPVLMLHAYVTSWPALLFIPLPLASMLTVISAESSRRAAALGTDLKDRVFLTGFVPPSARLGPAALSFSLIADFVDLVRARPRGAPFSLSFSLAADLVDLVRVKPPSAPLSAPSVFLLLLDDRVLLVFAPVRRGQSSACPHTH